MKKLLPYLYKKWKRKVQKTLIEWIITTLTIEELELTNKCARNHSRELQMIILNRKTDIQSSKPNN